MKEFFRKVFCGIVIGVGCVLPGVSGGIMAISMGLYEGMISAISGFFKAVKRNFLYLLPLGIGGAVGLVLTSNVLSIFLEKNEASVMALFAGLVLGSLPSLFLEAKGEDRFKKRYAVAAVCGLLFVLAFGFLESSVTTNESVAAFTPVTAIIAGAVLSIGVVIPGASSSFLLIYMGLYAALLDAMAGIMNISLLLREGLSSALSKMGSSIVTLMMVAVGFGAVALLLIKLVNAALKRYHALSYFAILGFVIGSVALVMPNIIRGLTWFTPVLFLAGLLLSIFEGYMRARKAAVPPPLEESVEKEPVLFAEASVETDAPAASLAEAEKTE